ncbi:MAG: thioredoxin [Phycisphaeraceae bacterium]|nr:MAG: thioredoxin [Phycisphaeraceae bacterium]
MAGQNVTTFTDANFDAEVLKSQVPVLVDFWAEWCGPCRMLGPTIEALAGKYAGRAKIGKVDVDTNRQLAATYQIAAIPTVMVFKGGQVVKTFRGLTNEATLSSALEGAGA